MIDFIYTVDYAVLNFIQEHIANPVLDAFMRLYTHLGDHGLFMIAVACVLMIFKKTRKIGITMGVALFIGTLTTNVVIKPLVGRIRPYDNSAWNPLLLRPLLKKGKFLTRSYSLWVSRPLKSR